MQFPLPAQWKINSEFQESSVQFKHLCFKPESRSLRKQMLCPKWRQYKQRGAASICHFQLVRVEANQVNSAPVGNLRVCLQTIRGLLPGPGRGQPRLIQSIETLTLLSVFWIQISQSDSRPGTCTCHASNQESTLGTQRKCSEIESYKDIVYLEALINLKKNGIYVVFLFTFSLALKMWLGRYFYFITGVFFLLCSLFFCKVQIISRPKLVK